MSLLEKNSQKANYSVIGAGAWGTALANIISNNGNKVKIYARNKNLVQEINYKHQNSFYLDDIILHDNLIAYNDLNLTIGDSNRVILAIPAQQLRHFLIENKKNFTTDKILILCAKGIENTSGYFMSQIIEEILPNNKIAIISGPSFAKDVAANLPAAVTIASHEISLAQQIAQEISSHKFRNYASSDIIGVQIGGALKNIFAIACGVLASQNLGQSAQSALITRSFAEMRRIGLFLGAKIETLCGLSGFGDLILSCSSTQSRNFAYGLALGRGEKLPNKLAEGYYSCEIAAKICQENNIKAPIINAVSALLKKQTTVTKICQDILNRPLALED